MATACKEALPLVSDTMLLSVKIKMNTAKGASSDDDIVRYNSNLDGLDGIAESIETEEGRASLLELTKGMDELLEATINGENTDAILDALEKKGYAFDEQCK